MNNALTDVIVHVDERLDEQRMGQLEDDVRMEPGVVSVGHRPGQTHLLMVVYDAERTHAAELLSPFAIEGLHAQLVGL